MTDKPEAIEQLRHVPLLPDSTGNALRVSDGPIFSCYAADVPTCWQKKLEAAGAMRVLSDKVYCGLETSGQRFLRQLGISRPSRQDIVYLCVQWHLGLPDTANFHSGSSAARSRLAEDADATEGPVEVKGLQGDNIPSDTLRCAIWASLACLRQHFLIGASGGAEQREGRRGPAMVRFGSTPGAI